MTANGRVLMLCTAFRGLLAFQSDGSSGDRMKTTSRTLQRLNPFVFALLPLMLGSFLLTGCAAVGSAPPVNSPAGVKPEPHALPTPGGSPGRRHSRRGQ